MYRFQIFILVSLFSIICLSIAGCTAHSKKERYVVVLSMDGFRSDYPSHAHTPTLDSLACVGVKAAFRPSFPSVTFPNHYSMATGLHPDHHDLTPQVVGALGESDHIMTLGLRDRFTTAAVRHHAYGKQ